MRRNFSLINLILIAVFLVLSFSGCGTKMDVNKLNEKAIEYMNQGDVDAAIARLESILDIDDTHAVSYYNLGVAYHEKEDYQKAISNLIKATELKRSFKEAFFALGVASRDFSTSMQESLTALINQEIEAKRAGKELEPSAEKELSKLQLKAIIIENLELSQKSYQKYVKLAENSDNLEKIQLEIEQIAKQIEFYREKEKKEA